MCVGRRAATISFVTKSRAAERLLAFSGVLFLALFAGGLLAADVLATTSFPEPSRPFGEVVAYFLGNPWPVRILSTCHAFAAIALLAFTAYAGAVLRRPDSDGLRRPTVTGFGGPTVTGSAGPTVGRSAWWRPPGARSRPACSCSTPPSSGPWRSRRPRPAPLWSRPCTTCPTSAAGWPWPCRSACSSPVCRRPAGKTGSSPGWLRWAGALAALETALYGATLLGAEGTWSPSGVLVVGAVLPLLWVGAASLVLARSVSRSP